MPRNAAGRVKRTDAQNRALHKWLELVSEALNDAGLDVRHTLREEIEIPWNKDLAKEHLWRPVQKAVLGKESTTEPERSEYTQVYDVLNRHLGEKLGIHVPWPTL